MTQWESFWWRGSQALLLWALVRRHQARAAVVRFDQDAECIHLSDGVTLPFHQIETVVLGEIASRTNELGRRGTIKINGRWSLFTLTSRFTIAELGIITRYLLELVGESRGVVAWGQTRPRPVGTAQTLSAAAGGIPPGARQLILSNALAMLAWPRGVVVLAAFVE